VSRAVSEGFDVPETGVRNSSQYADTLHRQDPDADEPRPACPEAEYREDAEFTDVPVAAYPTYDLCGNPECFGGEWR
jgi:hypothetical protein